MKHIVYTLLFAAALISVSSCDKDDVLTNSVAQPFSLSVPSLTGFDTEVVVTTDSIAPQTRSVGTPDAGIIVWEEGNKLMLDIKFYVETKDVVEAKNAAGESITPIANTNTYTEALYNNATDSWDINDVLGDGKPTIINGIIKMPALAQTILCSKE